MIFSMGMLCPFRMGQPLPRKLFSAPTRGEESFLPRGRPPVKIPAIGARVIMVHWRRFIYAGCRERRLPLVAVLAMLLGVSVTARANKFPSLHWSNGPD